MLCIYHQSTDPYFNIATDEYILKHIEEDCFMLWRNDNAIIVGKHQNALAEINYEYVKQNNIHVVRRLSGGGAVYHDLGNLNFSFTKQGKSSEMVDFKLYTQPIIEVLHSLGIEAKFEGRNDITIDGMKISGNAEHLYKHKLLHHGTLLFASQMKNVSEALKIHPLKYQDKAVKSVPKRVTNISQHLKIPITLEEFTQKIMNHIVNTTPNATLYEFTKDDLIKIEAIKQERYVKEDWNFGLIANYNFNKSIKTNGGIVEIHLIVEKGIIKEAKIYGDFFNLKDIAEIENALQNSRHDENSIRKIFENFVIDEYFMNITLDEIISAMF